jgi:hypothetical protein
MVNPTYSKSHGDWDEAQPSPSNKSGASFVDVVFGSCTGVMGAASHIFTPSTLCHRANRSTKVRNKSRSPKSRRSKSPSLRKSEEVVEIPEFLNADISSVRKASHSPTDDISAISSHTLDEMAKQKFLAEKATPVLTPRGAGPPSPTLTDVSEDLPVPGQSYLRRYGMETAALSGMLQSTHALAGTSHINTSMSSIGFGSNSDRQRFGEGTLTAEV